jgi:uncharacterized OsmC-like protein
MSAMQLRESLAKVSAFLTASPEKGRSANPEATASIVDGLKCRVSGPGGENVETDMPRAIGGGATAPSPGWLMRAALASCNATSIALRAATAGIELSRLEVTVTSESDARGLLGLDASVSPALQNLRVHVRIGAAGTPAEDLAALARTACSLSPVGCTDAGTATVEVEVDVEAA